MQNIFGINSTQPPGDCTSSSQANFWNFVSHTLIIRKQWQTRGEGPRGLDPHPPTSLDLRVFSLLVWSQNYSNNRIELFGLNVWKILILKYFLVYLGSSAKKNLFYSNQSLDPLINPPPPPPHTRGQWAWNLSSVISERINVIVDI